VIETDDAIKLKADLAGMDPADINIEVQDNVLTVSGERRFEEEVKEDKFYRIERRYGSFSRSLALPPDRRRDQGGSQVRERVARDRGPQDRGRETQEDRRDHRRADAEDRGSQSDRDHVVTMVL
jgi:HSP20 family protein